MEIKFFFEVERNWANINFNDVRESTAQLREDGTNQKAVKIRNINIAIQNFSLHLLTI